MKNVDFVPKTRDRTRLWLHWLLSSHVVSTSGTTFIPDTCPYLPFLHHCIFFIILFVSPACTYPIARTEYSEVNASHEIHRLLFP